MADKGRPSPPGQGDLFSPSPAEKATADEERGSQARSKRSPKSLSTRKPRSASLTKPRTKPDRQPKVALTSLSELTLAAPNAMSEAQITEELAWHKARVRDLQFHLRAKGAAASSAAQRRASQLSAEAVHQTVERLGGGYGAQVQAARELNVSTRTVSRKLQTWKALSTRGGLSHQS